MDTLPGITDLDMLHFLFEMDNAAHNELTARGIITSEVLRDLQRNMELHRRLIFQMFKEGVYSLAQLQMDDA